MAANKESMRCAFLIEGMQSTKTTTRFKEVPSAKALAKANSEYIFDPIVSYSPVHLGSLLQTLSREEWPLFTLYCLVYFSAEGPGIDIIEYTVKSGLNYLIEQQVIEILPKWLTDLTSEESIAHFAKEQMAEAFSNDRDKMTVYLEEMNNKIVALSNALSLEKFLEFISGNQDIDIIYGLIGDAHIGFIDKTNGVQIIQQTDNYRHIEMKFQNKLIKIKFFGGVHGEMDHFYRLQSECEKDGLFIPVLPKQESDTNTQLLLTWLCSLMVNPVAQNSASSAKIEPEYKGFDLEEAVAKFGRWMKDYSHVDSTDTESAIEWLYCDGGAKNVSNYEDFCCFVNELKTRGYDIPQTPSEADFQEGIARFKRQQAYWKDFERRKLDCSQSKNEIKLPQGTSVQNFGLKM